MATVQSRASVSNWAYVAGACLLWLHNPSDIYVLSLVCDSSLAGSTLQVVQLVSCLEGLFTLLFDFAAGNSKHCPSCKSPVLGDQTCCSTLQGNAF